MVTDSTPNFVTVSTPRELQDAVDARETHYIITGELVQNFRNHKKARRILIIVSMIFVVIGIFAPAIFENEYLIALTVFGIILGAITLAFKGLPIAIPFSFRTAGVSNAFKVMRSGKAWFNPDGSISAVIRYKKSAL